MAELLGYREGCYKFRMAFHPRDWFQTNAVGTPPEPRRQFAAGVIVWVLAWMVVWWNQDVRTALSAQQSVSPSATQNSSAESSNVKPDATANVQKVWRFESSATASIISWLGSFIGLGLFWGGGLLIFRSLTGWGFCLPWLRRCDTVERLSLVSAAALTLSAIVLHWFWLHIHAWMLAAVVALFVLASAFGWKLPGKKHP